MDLLYWVDLLLLNLLTVRTVVGMLGGIVDLLGIRYDFSALTFLCMASVCLHRVDILPFLLLSLDWSVSHGGSI
jgi:hypothetical protein